jgi:acetyl esterase/lipase
MIKILFTLTSLLFLQSCTQIIFAVANAPVHSFGGEIRKNIPYGELPKQKLDIYLPEASTSKHPVIVFLHGGRWTIGDKSQYQFVGMTMANLGYIVVIPDTRLYPEIKFPTFVEDTAKSIAWVHNNIAKYGASSDLFVTGHSSGAHMAALVVADESYLAAFDLPVSVITAFAGMSGPYDFEPQAPELKDIFGPPSKYPKMVVTNFIDGTEPPMLLMYTQDDETVHIQNLRKLESGIQAANGAVQTIIYESGGHASPVAAFSWANPAELPIASDMDQFFRSHISSHAVIQQKTSF